MNVEVREDHIVEDALGSIQQAAKVSSERYEVGLELGHGVLPQTSGAETYTLAKRADPILVLAAVYEVGFVLSLYTERTELARAYVFLIPERFFKSRVLVMFQI